MIRRGRQVASNRGTRGTRGGRRRAPRLSVEDKSRAAYHQYGMSGTELARTAHIGKSAASKWRGILAVEHIRAEEAAQQETRQLNQAAQ